MSRRKGAAAGGGFISISAGWPALVPVEDAARRDHRAGGRGPRSPGEGGGGRGFWIGRGCAGWPWRVRGGWAALTCSQPGLAAGLRAAGRPGADSVGRAHSGSPRPEPPGDGERVRRGARAKPRSPRPCVRRRPVSAVSVRRRVRVRTRGPRSSRAATAAAAAASHRLGPECGAPRLPSPAPRRAPPSRLCPAGEAPPPPRSQAGGRREATDHRLRRALRRVGGGCRPMGARGRG